MDMPTDVDFRKTQESISTLLDGGYLKEFAAYQWTLFKEYCNQGFNEEQALKLVIGNGSDK